MYLFILHIFQALEMLLEIIAYSHVKNQFESHFWQ